MIPVAAVGEAVVFSGDEGVMTLTVVVVVVETVASELIVVVVVEIPDAVIPVWEVSSF